MGSLTERYLEWLQRYLLPAGATVAGRDNFLPLDGCALITMHRVAHLENTQAGWSGGEAGRFTVKSRLFQTKGYEERIVDDSRDFQTHVLLEIRDSGPCPGVIDPVNRPVVIALLGKGLLHLGGDIDP
jgi:hypothetical protein